MTLRGLFVGRNRAGRRGRRGWRPPALAAIALLAGNLLAQAAGTAWATDAFPTTDDLSVNIGTSNLLVTNNTAAQLGSVVTQQSMRITRLRVHNPSVPTFDATLVANSGPYGSAWWWYYDQTVQSLNSALTTNHARLISIDPYQSSSGLRFAAVMVPNTESQARVWWWGPHLTEQQLATGLGQNDARLVDIRPYFDGLTRVFAVIMLKNTGADEKSWKYDIQTATWKIDQDVNSLHMRIVALSGDPAGGFDAVMVASEGERTHYYTGLDAQDVGPILTADKARAIDFSRYVVQGVAHYALVDMDTVNDYHAPADAESVRVHNYAEANGWGGGWHGEYFAPASGTAIVDENSGFRFEPSSAIESLYGLSIMRKVTAGTAHLTDQVTYYPDPADPSNVQGCPDPSWETAGNAHTTTLNNALNKMLGGANNVMARAVVLKYGLPSFASEAATLGMSNTALAQATIGCGFRGGVRNETTLQDAAALFRSVVSGTSISGPNRTTFMGMLQGGIPTSTTPFASVVKDVAANLGKTADVPAFLAASNLRYRSGFLPVCLDAGCMPFKVDASEMGRLILPFKDAQHHVQNTPFVFGVYVNDLFVACQYQHNCQPGTDAQTALDKVAAESARKAIRMALKSW